MGDPLLVTTNVQIYFLVQQRVILIEWGPHYSDDSWDLIKHRKYRK